LKATVQHDLFVAEEDVVTTHLQSELTFFVIAIGVTFTLATVCLDALEVVWAVFGAVTTVLERTTNPIPAWQADIARALRTGTAIVGQEAVAFRHEPLTALVLRVEAYESLANIKACLAINRAVALVFANPAHTVTTLRAYRGASAQLAFTFCIRGIAWHFYKPITAFWRTWDHWHIPTFLDASL
jgi:hypothetical protein